MEHFKSPHYPHRAETPLYHYQKKFEFSDSMGESGERRLNTLFEKKILTNQLCREIIDSDPNLEPNNILTLDEKTWFLPEVLTRAEYTSPERDDRGSGYLEFVCFVEYHGSLIPRVFYKSNSDGNWRSGIMRYENGGFSKGSEAVDNYTQTNKPCNELLIYLEGISVIADHGKLRDNVSPVRDWGFLEYELQEGTEPYETKFKHTNSFKEEVSEFDDGGALDTINKFPISRYTWDDMEEYGGVERVEHALSSLSYPEGFIPDFRKPKKIIEFFHTLLGPVRVETFDATLNNTKIEWNVAYDKMGRVWIDSIIDPRCGLTTYGTQKKIIQAGILNSKPLDYTHQINGFPSIEKNEGETFGIIRLKGHYSDFTPVLDVLRPIQEFRNARGIRSIALDNPRNQQEVEWPDISQIRNYFRIDNSFGRGVWMRPE